MRTVLTLLTSIMPALRAAAAWLAVCLGDRVAALGILEISWLSVANTRCQRSEPPPSTIPTT